MASTDLLVSLLSSASAVAVTLFVLRRLFEKYLERTFRRADLTFESELRTAESRRQELYKSQLGIYAEVLEVIYRARNTAKICTAKAAPFEVVEEFSACRYHLVENLYKYRIFFGEPLFRRLHNYKSLLQEFGVLLDEVTRSAEVDDSPVDPQIREISTRQLQAKYRELEKLFEYLDREIRKVVADKTNLAEAREKQ